MKGIQRRQQAGQLPVARRHDNEIEQLLRGQGGHRRDRYFLAAAGQCILQNQSLRDDLLQPLSPGQHGDLVTGERETAAENRTDHACPNHQYLHGLLLSEMP